MRSTSHLRRTFLVLLAVVGAGILVGQVADAQVLVWKLSFRDTIGKSINFEFFTGGYFVAPAEGGTGTFIFTRGSHRDRVYTTVENSGQYFIASNKKKKVGVISAAGGDGTATSSYLLFGDVESTYRRKGGNIKFARKLNGVCLAADSELDFEEPAPDGSQGFAGMLEINARYESQTAYKSGSVAASVSSLTGRLERIGYMNADAVATTTASGGSTGTVDTSSSTGGGSGAGSGSGGGSTTAPLSSPTTGLGRRPFNLTGGYLIQ